MAIQNTSKENKQKNPLVYQNMEVYLYSHKLKR